MLFAAIAAVLVGCSNDDDLAPQQKNVLPEDGVIRVETSVNDIRSRAIGYATNGLTEFGLFVENATNETYSYSNVRMTKDASDTWTSYKSDGTTPWMMLWQSESATVNVTAYAPYNADAATSGGTLTGNVEEDQTDGGKLSDVLYANSSVTPNDPKTDNDIYYDTAGKKLNVKMNHVMSKLTVNIKYGTELTQDGTPSPTFVSLTETKTGYSFALSNGKVTATGSVGDIKMATADNSADGYVQSYEAILVPQNAAFNVVVVLNGNRYIYSHSGFDFKGGNAYTLNLVVGKDITNIGNITASEWVTSIDDIPNGGSLETE